jgi:chorismate-pyruvate lyase
MPLTTTSVLYPLDEFYLRAGLPVPSYRPLRGEEVPEPYGRLLVHRRDMTPTLEAFHGERIHLRLLERRVQGEQLEREVVLTLDESARPVEFGAIVIHCDRFPEQAREVLLACRCPLGTILHDFRIEHSSSPQGYFEVTSDGLISSALELEGPHTLYGRRNVLSGGDGKPLAEVIEILPPL